MRTYTLILFLDAVPTTLVCGGAVLYLMRGATSPQTFPVRQDKRHGELLRGAGVALADVELLWAFLGCCSVTF